MQPRASWEFLGDILLNLSRRAFIFFIDLPLSIVSETAVKEIV